MSIPGGVKSKWLYIELDVVSAATGTISVRMNNTSANTADTYISIPALTVPEFVGLLIPVAPFLPKIVNKLKKLRKAKKLWKPKRD